MQTNEQLTLSGRRYACFTAEQQEAFDRLGEKAQRYVLYLGQGLGKKAAYVAAGYKDSENSNKGARVLEGRNPIIRELVEALRGHSERRDVYKEGTEISKQIDKMAAGPLDDVPIIPMDLVGTEDRVKIEEFTEEQARRAQFYRRVLNGEIKNVKKKTRYDKDMNVIGYEIEETTDIPTRMKARVELDKIIGIKDMLNTVGQISVGNITINIVDASKKDEKDDERNNIIVGEGVVDNGNDGAAE